MTNTSQDTEEFIERMGLITQAEGLPRIAGRIMGFMIIYGGPFSFSDLTDRLKVSRSSISTNTCLLENLGVIERVARPGDRQDYFQIRPNPYVELLKGSLNRLNRARDAVVDMQQKLPTDMAGAHQRLHELGEFYIGLIHRTDEMIKHAKKKHHNINEIRACGLLKDLKGF